MPKKRAFYAAQLEDYAARYQSGESFRDIAASTGCSYGTVRSAMIAFGVVPNAGRSISRKKAGRQSGVLGHKWSEESRKRLSASLRGRAGTRFGPHSEETISKISAATKGKNRKYTHEQKIEVERVRQACKRFVARVLRATGKRKIIPSERYLGYSSSQLREHLGWRPPGAHIDHHVPIVEFIRRGITSVAVINALPNLRWLSAGENRKKGASVPNDADEIIERCVTREVAYTSGLAAMRAG